MTDFIVTGPDSNPVIGTPGDDRLIYTLDSGPGGVVLENLSDDLPGGHGGSFDAPGPNDTPFSGIENFTFVDKVGGDDRIFTGNGIDVLSGGGGKDTLNGGNGDDILNGNASRDRLFGGQGNDQLDGGNGNDLLNGGQGDDILFGGDGNDVLIGGNGNDRIEVFGGNNRLSGGGGNDVFFFDSGNNTVDGGRGRDLIQFGPEGPATINGGPGQDTVAAYFYGADPDGSTVNFDMRTGNHQIIGPPGGGGPARIAGKDIEQSTITNVENYTFLGSLDAEITGDAKKNILTGGFASDTLRGGKGGDTLFGQTGDDRLFGENGNDRLFGGSGDDTLTGGRGADHFGFNGGQDRIRDFKDNVDSIEIAAFLLAFGTTVQDIVDDARLKNGNTVLDLGSGNILTVNGLKDASLLADDLVIV